MRMTIDLPDEMHRILTARAASHGTTVEAVILELVEQLLRPPPVIVAPRGIPIEALSASELRRLQEADDMHALRVRDAERPR